MSNAIKNVIELKASVSRVWRAVTDHEEFGQWFRIKLDKPFKVGEITSGPMTYPGHEHLIWRALVHVIEPERRFVFSWNPYDVDDNFDLKQETTEVEFLLEPTETGTRLTVTESGFDALTDPRRFDALRRNAEGWAIQVQNIIDHVES